MIIDVARISPDGENLEGDEPPEILAVSDYRGISAQGPIRYSLFAQVVSGELIVTGTLCGKISLPCSRCAKPVCVEVRDPAFERVRDMEAGEESVDLTADIREAMILAFPNYPLCDADCRGLCPQCGVDLNEGKCDCKPLEDPRWNALDALNGGARSKDGCTEKENIQE